MQKKIQSQWNKVSYKISNQFFNLVGHLLVKEWNPKLLGLSKLPIRSIIDVGANDGNCSQKLSRIFPQSHIYSFEPLPEPFKKLEQWGKQQKGRVKVFNIALGDSIQAIEITKHLYFNQSSSILKTTQLCERIYPMVKKQQTIVVQQSTLDHKISSLPTPLAPDILIKLDVQGYEDRVIRGGIETFKQAIACIVEISLDILYQEQADFKDIFLWLDQLGYCYAGNLDQVQGKDGHVRYFNAVFIKKNSRNNYAR
ncbi:MAG: FkbM family methyltransferase [Coleofasciculus sp.]